MAGDAGVLATVCVPADAVDENVLAFGNAWLGRGGSDFSLLNIDFLLPANGVDIVVGSKSFGVAGIGMLTVDVVDDVLELSLGAPCRSNEAEPAESLALLLPLLPALDLRSLEGVLDLSLSLSAAEGSTDSDPERCDPALLVLDPAALLPAADLLCQLVGGKLFLTIFPLLPNRCRCFCAHSPDLLIVWSSSSSLYSSHSRSGFKLGVEDGSLL